MFRPRPLAPPPVRPTIPPGFFFGGPDAGIRCIYVQYIFDDNSGQWYMNYKAACETTLVWHLSFDLHTFKHISLHYNIFSSSVNIIVCKMYYTFPITALPTTDGPLSAPGKQVTIFV